MPTRLAACLVLGSLTLAVLRAQEGPATTPLPRVEVHGLDVRPGAPSLTEVRFEIQRAK